MPFLPSKYNRRVKFHREALTLTECLSVDEAVIVEKI